MQCKQNRFSFRHIQFNNLFIAYFVNQPKTLFMNCLLDREAYEATQKWLTKSKRSL